MRRASICPRRRGLRRLVDLAEAVVAVVVPRALTVRFWQNPHAQDELRGELIHLLDDRDVFPFDERPVPAIADKLLELAKANRALIAKRRSGEAS